jgi:hypothetical protein
MTAIDSMSQAKVLLIDSDRIAGGIHVQNREMLDTLTHLQQGASVINTRKYGSPELARMASKAKLALLAKQQSVVTTSELIFPRSARLAFVDSRFGSQTSDFMKRNSDR